jgi:hypothetical protein
VLFSNKSFKGTGVIFIMQLNGIIKLPSVLSNAHKMLDNVLPDCTIVPLPMSTHFMDKTQVLFAASSSSGQISIDDVQEKVSQLHSFLKINGQVADDSHLTSIAIEGQIEVVQT